MSAEANSQLRERRATDEAFRQRENEIARRYRLRKQAEAAGDPVPEDAALLKRKEKESPWFEDWLRLNSEDPEIVALAKKNCRHRMDVTLAMANKALANSEPKREKVEEPEEGFGLADEY